eukprot:NODE_916_length_1377_cov_137.064759_g261_i1.p1 GENE.NODE_916_length_1377_cov_137.064759_g261_i1~~NODE_916_length_1377_cov_137.064759_g261_i1.p1  ORF type:complete len:269 (-),score=120.81 NODE_916_length_1377_cov_137.064759_g261_i1:231-1037(-)
MAWIRQMKDAIARIDQELQEYTGDRAEKYKELEAKDREMQGFIDRFDAGKKEANDEIARHEEVIVRLLEGIAKHLHFSKAMPSQQDAKELQNDLEFKKQQLNFTQSTHERLKSELDLRRKELEKVENLDTKISQELVAIVGRIHQNEESIRKYSNLEALRMDADQRKRDLYALRGRSHKRKDALKKAVALVSANKHEPASAALTSNELHSTLQAKEQKIKQVQQQVFALSDFIAAKSHEANFEPVKMQCMAMVDDINKHIETHLLQQP